MQLQSSDLEETILIPHKTEYLGHSFSVALLLMVVFNTGSHLEPETALIGIEQSAVVRLLENGLYIVPKIDIGLDTRKMKPRR